MTPPEHLLPMLGIAYLAGLIQGLSGFGSALVAVPLMAMLLPVQTVVPLMALLGTSISTFNLLHLRHAVELRPISRLLAGYLIGTPLGLVFLTHAPADLILGLLGAFISLYALFALSGRYPRSRWLRDSRLTLGMLSGAMGSAFSTNGPPIILHVAARPEWSADRQKSVLVVFLLSAGLITLAALTIGGLISAEVLLWLLWVSPLLLAGTLSGTFIYRRLGDRGYKQLTYLLILVTGLLLSARALLA